MRRLLILAALIVAVRASAQEIPPIDRMAVELQPSTSGALVVEVVASDGSALPGVTVTAMSMTGAILMSVTDVNGRAKFIVPPGSYQVASSYREAYRSTAVTVDATGGSARIELPIGPVPRVSPQPAQPSPAEPQPVAAPVERPPTTLILPPQPAPEVEERTFKRLADLRAWLAQHAALGLQLSSVVSASRGKSVFRFTRVFHATVPDLQTSTRQPDAAAIAKASSNHVTMRYCGVHQLGRRSYVLAFCSP